MTHEECLLGTKTALAHSPAHHLVGAFILIVMHSDVSRDGRFDLELLVTLGTRVQGLDWGRGRRSARNARSSTSNKAAGTTVTRSGKRRESAVYSLACADAFPICKGTTTKIIHRDFSTGDCGGYNTHTHAVCRERTARRYSTPASHISRSSDASRHFQTNFKTEGKRQNVALSRLKKFAPTSRRLAMVTRRDAQKKNHPEYLQVSSKRQIFYTRLGMNTMQFEKGSFFIKQTVHLKKIGPGTLR